MSEKAHWMPLYVQAFVADTRDMTLEEKGAYMDLLIHQWLNHELPQDEDRKRRLTGSTSRQWARIWPALEPRFPGGVNAKLERVRSKHLARSKAGKKSNKSPTQCQQTSNIQSNKLPTLEVRGKRLDVRSSPNGEEKQPPHPVPDDLRAWVPEGYLPDLEAALRAARMPAAVIGNLRMVRDGPEALGIAGPVSGEEVGMALRSGAQGGFHPTAASLKTGIEKARKLRAQPPAIRRGRGLYDDDEQGVA